MDCNSSDADGLSKLHVDLCEWAIEELHDLEGSTSEETASYDKAIEIILTKSGRAVPQELYGWLKGLLPRELRPGLLAEATRLKWPCLPVDLLADEQAVASEEVLMRDHKDWDALRICLRRLWDRKQSKGVVPLESSGNQVIAHIGLQPFNEALSMAAERLHQSVGEIVSAWDSHNRRTLQCKNTVTSRARVWKPGILKLRKQTELQSL